ncbi:MAG: DUF4038 domain-containing protein [Anaerolineae bacterium]
MVKIPQYGIYDFTLQSDTEHDNPFRLRLEATFEHKSGVKIERVPGFYNGDEEFVVRFSPPLQGGWRGQTSSDDPRLDGVWLEPIEVTPPENPNAHGTLGIDPANAQRFAWQDGTAWVYLGFECDWLFAYHQREPEKAAEHIGLIADRGFDAVVTNVYAHTGFSTPGSRFEGDIIPGTVYGPPDMYVFEGTNDDPDHSRLNVDFFKDYDAMMCLLAERGIVAHIMIQVQNKHVNWPDRLSLEDETFWRYVVARYQAFGNVIWDIGKESYNLLRETGSHDYTLSRIALIRETDAYGHLVTVHDAEAGSSGRYSEADAASDVISDQIHLSHIDRYNREARRKLQLRPKPYINIEYGYEMGVEPLRTYQSRTTAPWQDVLLWTYAIYLAGAYACYYYSNTSWDLIRFKPEPPGWERYRYLRDLLDELPFNHMTSLNTLVDQGYCLAAPGEAYLVYLPEGGDVLVDLTEMPATRGDRGQILKAETPIPGEWMDVFTGERRQVEIEDAGWLTMVENPFGETGDPVVLVIQRRLSTDD